MNMQPLRDQVYLIMDNSGKDGMSAKQVWNSLDRKVEYRKVYEIIIYGIKIGRIGRIGEKGSYHYISI